MKFLSILLFSSLILWSTAKAATLFSDNQFLDTLNKTENTVNSIKVKSLNPLRDVDQNLKTYTNLLQTFNEFKEFDTNFTNSILAKVKNHDTLSGEELFALRRTITIYYKINKVILDFAKVYDFGGFKMSKTFIAQDHHTPLIKAHLIWLSGHLLVLDYLEQMHNLLYENKGVFRRIVKNALIDKDNNQEGTDKTLRDIIKINQYTIEIGESAKFSQQINLVKAIAPELKDVLANEADTKNLIDAVTTNKTAIEISRGKTKFNVSNYSVVDSIINVFDTITGTLSSVFGNIAGSIHWRKGFLFGSTTAREITRSNLKPMDILIEKSPFVLTDKFIPGHYGHVAIYLGTEEQLKAINMWDHPSIIPYQEQISAGKTIIEAVRPGVRLNSVEEFLNIDELTIVSKSDILDNPNELIESITRAMDQIGKKYDFNFDVSTLDKIVCSELIYIAFGNINWPTQYRFGRATVTPDNIAEILFQKNTKFKVKKFMVAKEERRIDLVDISYISDELDYELRAKDGTPAQDSNAENSYWKKETKCYTVNKSATAVMGSNATQERICNTSYKEYYYEERAAI